MKTRLTGATFDASEKTITHASFSDVTLAGIQLITNVTDQIIIYNFADTTKGGTLSTDTLTLEYDTTSMSDTDELMILVEDGSASTAINDGGNTITVDNNGTFAVQASLNAGTNNIGDVDVLSSALPTGASTLAEQQSQTTHLSTIAGDTTSIQTAVELLDDTVATDGSATPTKGILMAGQDGTNAQAIKTDTNGELQVDVLTMPTTTVQATDLDIRNLTNTDVVTAELSAVDNAVLDNIDADLTTIIGHVDGLETSNSAIQTSVQLIDDTVATTASAIPTKGIAISGTDGTNSRVIKTDTSGELQVDVLTMPTVAVTQSGTWDEVGINDSGNSITIDVNGTAVSSTNPLLIGSMAIQDTGNSTTATLGSGGNFTGTAFDLNSYSSWSINIFSDKASSSNGLVVQWSDDGTNWDFSDAITYVASVGNMITFGRKARYVRLNYTNTNSAQTVFRVTAYAEPLSVRQTRKFVGSALSDGETGQVVIAGIQGHTTAGGGAWVDVKVSPSGSLSADVSGSTLGANSGVDIGDVTINNASGASAVNIQDGGNTITVDGTVTANLAAGTNNIGDVDILSIAAGDNNIGNVDVVTLPSLPAGTNAIGKLAANADVNIGSTRGLPSDIDINGSNANHADKYYTNAGAVTDGIIWSPAAGKRWHVLTLYINVSAAATVTIEDDLAGGDVARWKGELAANSGVVLTYNKEHPFCSTEDAADLIITTSAGNVYVQAVGYEV